MKTIALIVEGDGEVEALPLLLRKIDVSHTYLKPVNTKGRGNLHKKLENWLERLRYSEEPPDAVIILQDADENCPRDLAKEYVQRITLLNLPFSVHIVIANCEYEAWFLADIASLRNHYEIPETAVYDSEPEEKRDAKGALSALMQGNNIYSPTIHQARMSALININRVRERSRSFRRLCHAVEEAASDDVLITPHIPESE